MLEVEYIQEYDSEAFRSHTFVGFVVGFEVATKQVLKQVLSLEYALSPLLQKSHPSMSTRIERCHCHYQ